MIDIGANLTDSCFSERLDQLLARAHICGVEKIIVTGTNIENSVAATKLCEQYSQLFCTAGIHPHQASEYSDTVEAQISQLLNHPKVIAVGETGLDFNRNFSTPTEQINAFIAQINLAAHHQMPLFLHERDAFDTQFKILKEHQEQLHGAVIHCFTGDQQALHAYLELDLYIGITGWICDERRGQTLQQLVKEIPDNRLLIETDAPYLTPRDLPNKIRRRKNEPANLPHIAKTIARLRDQSTEQVIHLSTQNSKRLFKNMGD